MEQTLFLAQFLGIFSIILAIVIILRRKLIVRVVGNFFQNRTLSFLFGIIEVAAGLLLILSHPSWNSTLEIVITIFGWLILLEGILYLFAIKKLLRSFLTILDNASAYYFFAVLYLLLGLYLVYAGFQLSI